MSDSQPREVRLKDYVPPTYLVDTVDLHFDLDDARTLVTAALKLRRNPDAATTDPVLTLFGRDLELLSLRLDGRELGEGDYRILGENLSIAGVPDTFSLQIETVIHPRENTSLEGLYTSSGNFCTQCEPEGFRKITWFPDRPDVLARYTVTLVAEYARYPVLLANGNLVEAGKLPDGRHFARWDDPFPKPSYLFALVAGDLVEIADRFTTASGREVALRLYVEARNRAKCEHAMASLKKAMAWDEQVYGLEYDLDIYMIVAVDDFNMGAMENKGLNVFNSKYVLARPETATDADYQGIEGVIGHEYFHNWTGNRVTCRDWFQLSLKEGLTVFRDQQFSADMGSAAVKRIEDVRILRNSQFPEDAGPMAHPVRPASYVEINNFYTATVYNKGAEVIRMYHTLLGPERFRQGLRLYLERHDGQAATTDDFLRAMAEAGGIDLTQFQRWYEQAGTPELQVESAYDAATRTFDLTVRQSCPATPGQPLKEPFHIPLAAGLLGPDGRDLPLRLEGETAPAVAGTRVLELRHATETFRFVDLKERPVPSLLRGFSAPVRLRGDWLQADLALRMAHDSDPFNRWEAGQQLACDLLLRQVTAIGDGREEAFDSSFVAAFRAALNDAESDPALLALALTLPTETYLGEQLEVIDPAAIHQARESLRRHLGEELRDDFFQGYRRCRDAGPYRPEPAAIGRRSLKNLCLAYLMSREDADSLSLCLEQFEAADNMTDVLAALGCLANSTDPRREKALPRFREQWADDPLVLDKWFLLQATSRRPEALDEVRRLMADSAFNIRNPNKVRALIGAFCQGNPARFHAADGEGYRFCADQVLAIDPFNPQVAARLLGALSRWRRYDGARQGLMRKELERILAAEGLSPDCYEIAAKSLA
ncbi:aminopeptidase N [Trichloromonas acetexigens]|uniref:Aminopeptidase N n=1 Tax=Trichloromonas acetexigens TaxID=38815 RepID=A0A550JJ13_9BACT|nr:aminopeptidase N [Desulfuromonas acetexigens]TRO83200.1 aminopeptidase N [Desulfuromonas acetexigens]